MLRPVKARPPQIAWFIGLQCAGLALGAVKLLLNWRHLIALGSVLLLVLTFCFTIAILSFLIWKVSEGKNWARITVLVFFLIGALSFAFTLRSEFARSVDLASISIVQVAVQACSLILVFTSPANQWFRGSPQTPQPRARGGPPR